MIAAADYHNARAWLEGRQRPLLLAHRRPDGDALGALAALAHVLEGLGREPRPALFEPLPARYRLLEPGVRWHRWDQDRAALAAECDAVIVLDTCSWSQLGPAAGFVAQGPPALVIDHHPFSESVGTRHGDLRLLDETAAAACVLVAEWLAAAGLPCPPPVATALLTGVGTDTGWFRFPSTDARTLRVAAGLVEAGASAAEVHRAVYEQDPPAKLRLIGRMLQTLTLHAGDRLAVLMLRRADFAVAGAARELTEDLVNEAARLGCTEATLLFIEEPDGTVRVNFRSKRTLDVARLATRFGGGGHVRAAGARPAGVWDEVVPEVIAATVAALESPDGGPGSG